MELNTIKPGHWKKQTLLMRLGNRGEWRDIRGLWLTLSRALPDLAREPIVAALRHRTSRYSLPARTTVD